jgi:ribulose-5-phosphate 4-epimerase/fuculose-1-phosphate aldolase
MPANSTESDARRSLAAAHRLAVLHGLNEGVWNHLSLISPEDQELMLISPGHTHWSQVTASNLALVNRDGKQVGGEIPPTRSGWIIHYPVHMARPDATCVMHVHAPYITAMSIRNDIVFEPRSSQQAARFHNDLVYYETYDGVLNDEAEGQHMAEVLGGKRVLMLRNHGALIATDSVAKAYLDLYQLERACMYQLLATAGGGTTALIPQDIAAKMGDLARQGQNLEHFEGMERWVAQIQPDYAS